MRKMLRLLLFCFLTRAVFSLCPYECDCSNEPKQCPPGVSLVTDGCDCCKICARQVDEECNDDDMLCDPHRGLFCNFSNKQENGRGTCKAQTGNSCLFSGMRIPSGGSIEPSCKVKCWCLEDSVGCLPTCPHEVHSPNPNLCPNARLQQIDGECCDQWLCDTPSGGVRVLPTDEFWSRFVTSISAGPSDPSLPMYPDMDSLATNIAGDDYYDGMGLSEEEQELFGQGDVTDEQVARIESSWLRNLLPGRLSSSDAGSSCQAKVSSWSPCSKTCGLGVSSRVTNLNADCTLSREMRLCLLRPCQKHSFTPTRKRKCTRQKRSQRRIRVTYAGCQSTQAYRPIYCGLCREGDRCCSPRNSRTSVVQFACSNGDQFSKKMMFIKSCRCHKNCSANAHFLQGGRQQISSDGH